MEEHAGELVDVAALQLPTVSPRSYDEFDTVCRANAARIAAYVEALQQLPRPPKLCSLGAQPFSGGSATARARWDVRPPVEAVAVDLASTSLLDPLVDVCARHHCYVAATVFEKVPALPGRFFHTGFVVGPGGVELRSPKVQARSAPEVTSLRDLAEEYEAVFGPGSIVPVLATPYGRVACVVEKEIYAPEVGRLLAARGAEIVLHPSAAWVTHHPGSAERRAFSPEVEVRRVTAFTTACYVVTAHESRVFYGGTGGSVESRWSESVSTVTAPDGAELARIGPHAEGAAIATVDLARRRELADGQQSWTAPAQVVLEQLALAGGPAAAPGGAAAPPPGGAAAAPPPGESGADSGAGSTMPR